MRRRHAHAFRQQYLHWRHPYQRRHALTLSGANSYTGGTTISGGTLVATNVDALGTGDVTNSSTLELNTGGTFDNAISGSGQVVKSGDETHQRRHAGRQQR
ncbi:autotransporter-associated beta strand repeat-containing protein [Salmonella enterica]|uniref:autotransporter-associated beta strand repeat-containing protein n=1 Tax=Salmonella enterica TaxID=28901 RepID=UPI0021C374C2